MVRGIDTPLSLVFVWLVSAVPLLPLIGPALVGTVWAIALLGAGMLASSGGPLR
jgi:hypothetical protein